MFSWIQHKVGLINQTPTQEESNTFRKKGGLDESSPYTRRIMLLQDWIFSN
jgi:hypothetical protein